MASEHANAGQDDERIIKAAEVGSERKTFCRWAQ
jgi:hypothetical protein